LVKRKALQAIAAEAAPTLKAQRTMSQTKNHMHSYPQVQDRSRRRPLYGSVWLALFVMLRDGVNTPRGETGKAALSRGGSPSRRP
jgi:hypothetical protein